MPIIPIPVFRTMPLERFLSGKIIGVARIVCNGQVTLLREYNTRLRSIPKEKEQSVKERFAGRKCKREVCGLKPLNILFAYSRVVAAPDKLHSPS